MGRVIGCTVVGVTLALVACGSSSKTVPGVDRKCEAGARRCDGLNVKVCDEDGTLEAIEQTCLPSQNCSDGACVETSCVPNTKFCRDRAVYKCDSTGGGSALKETCPSGKFCVEDDGDAECSDTACTAGAPLCDGNVATTCAKDGSGAAPGGTDCAATQRACVQGSCRELTCSPGKKVCQEDGVYLCSPSGMALELLAECDASEACDGQTLACRPKRCEAGKLGCEDSRIVQCNEFGTAWEQAGEDCASQNKLCVAGSCKQQTCLASSYFCQDDDVYRCDEFGVTSSLYQACPRQGQHCQPSGNYAWCAYDDCQAGQVFCDGNTVKVCNDDNEIPNTGTECGEDAYCEDAECKPRVCKLYEYYCQDGNIHYCDYFGGSPAPQQVCPSETACKKIESGAACVPLPCSPGESACVGNKVGTCAADGSGLSKVTEDCAASSSICGTDAKCAKTVKEVVGVAESAELGYPGDFMGNVFEVTAARKLIEMEMNLVLASSRELRWVIYEQTGATFVARFDKVLSNQSGTGFLSSGAISYALKPGKRYALGVSVAGGDAISYYDGAPWSPKVSFGSTLGYVHASYSAQIGAEFYPYSDRLYQMRVTTDAP